MRLRVDLGERSYDVVLGPLDGLGEAVRGVGCERAVLVTNDRVAPLHAEAATRTLDAAGVRVQRLVVPNGEGRKDRDTWWSIVDGLLSAGVDRDTVVLSLGGGVTGDLAGFAAASTLRGLPFIQVPTTLLAMVDASVGGKTGFNTAQGKNLVGAFHQPKLVYAALDTLETLDDAEVRCGLGEVVKHAVLADPQLFGWLEREHAALARRDAEALRHVVRRCVEIKADVVRQDEREQGIRAVLNLGHTLGHALERVLGYGRIRHGEAVAVGMIGEATIAVGRGEAAPDLPRHLRRCIAALGLPTRVQDVDVDAVVAAMDMDKKRRRGMVRVACPVSIGEVRIVEAERAELTVAARAVINPEER